MFKSFCFDEVNVKFVDINEIKLQYNEERLKQDSKSTKDKSKEMIGNDNEMIKIINSETNEDDEEDTQMSEDSIHFKIPFGKCILKDIFEQHFKNEEENYDCDTIELINPRKDDEENKSLSILKFINSEDEDEQPASTEEVFKIQKKCRKKKKITVDLLENFFQSLSQNCENDIDYNANLHNTERKSISNPKEYNPIQPNEKEEITMRNEKKSISILEKYKFVKTLKLS
jgi:hypothetical protein